MTSPLDGSYARRIVSRIHKSTPLAMPPAGQSAPPWLECFGGVFISWPHSSWYVERTEVTLRRGLKRYLLIHIGLHHTCCDGDLDSVWKIYKSQRMLSFVRNCHSRWFGTTHWDWNMRVISWPVWIRKWMKRRSLKSEERYRKMIKYDEGGTNMSNFQKVMMTERFNHGNDPISWRCILKVSKRKATKWLVLCAETIRIGSVWSVIVLFVLQMASVIGTGVSVRWTFSILHFGDWLVVIVICTTWRRKIGCHLKNCKGHGGRFFSPTN